MSLKSKAYPNENTAQPKLMPESNAKAAIAANIPVNIGPAKVSISRPKTIIGPGNGFVAAYDGVINPYSGCTFGCDYCYASNFTRTEEEKNSWGKWVKAKANALELMKAVPAGAMNDRVYYISTVTDPYQPLERTARITRAILAAVAVKHPRAKLVVQTRSPLVRRDTDILRKIIDAGGRVQVNMTVTTDDDSIRKTFEPGCPSINARLRAITELQGEGIQSCITLTPLLPLSDPQAFTERLKETGVTRYIVQDFHLPDGGQETFIARTDRRAVQATTEHYQTGPNGAIKAYKQEHRRNYRILKDAIPDIGVGKAGFAPPF